MKGNYNFAFTMMAMKSSYCFEKEFEWELFV